jgi:hypothetical protein
VAGIFSSIETDSCIEALQQLRTEERLDVVGTDVLEENVLAFTLTDGPRRNAKTAILICQRDGVDDPDIVEDGETGDLAPIDETDDVPAEETEDIPAEETEEGSQDETIIE